MLRTESAELAKNVKSHTEILAYKASVTQLTETEHRLSSELRSVKENSEQMMERMEQRHDREMELMAVRLGEQIKASEAAIVRQIDVVLEVMRNRGRNGN